MARRSRRSSPSPSSCISTRWQASGASFTAWMPTTLILMRSLRPDARANLSFRPGFALKLPAVTRPPEALFLRWLGFVAVMTLLGCGDDDGLSGSNPVDPMAIGGFGGSSARDGNSPWASRDGGFNPNRGDAASGTSDAGLPDPAMFNCPE